MQRIDQSVWVGLGWFAALVALLACFNLLGVAERLDAVAGEENWLTLFAFVSLEALGAFALVYLARRKVAPRKTAVAVAVASIPLPAASLAFTLAVSPFGVLPEIVVAGVITAAVPIVAAIVAASMLSRRTTVAAKA